MPRMQRCRCTFTTMRIIAGQMPTERIAAKRVLRTNRFPDRKLPFAPGTVDSREANRRTRLANPAIKNLRHQLRGN